MQDNNIFEKYKPLRNAVRKLCLVESLGVVRAYAQDLQFGIPIPTDCEVHSEYASAKNKMDKARWITEFHLETLCREILLYADEGERCSESLKIWKNLARTINKLKELEDFISSRFATKELFFQEMHRIVHRQFPWQRSIPNARNIMRYYLVYKHPPLETIIKDTIGLDVDELLLVGMALLGTFIQNLALFYPPAINIPGLSIDAMDRFLRRFALELESLKLKLKADQQMDDKFAYAYNSLRAYPLLRMRMKGRDSLVCPLPTLLFWRFTSGVYYEICGHNSFANAFGEAFQSYVGQIINKAISNQQVTVHPDEQYRVGKDLKRTVDWIMAQSDAAIFLEAKTKRLAMDARVEGVSGEPLSAELDKMANMIIQVYKSIRDYRAGSYPQFSFNPLLQIYPVVVTLEDWLLMGPKIKSELDSKVLDGMIADDIPENWLREMPYTICSVDDFETTVQVINSVGIDKVMRGKSFDPAKQEWTLGAYLADAFRQESRGKKFLFGEEYERLHVEALAE